MNYNKVNEYYGNKRWKRRPAVARQPHQSLDYIMVSTETPLAEKSICPAVFHSSLTAVFLSMIYPK